jgi:hypothetical protein
MKVLDQLFGLARRIGIQGQEHEQVLEAADALLDAIEQAEPPFSLQFPGEGVLRERVALPLSVEDFRRCQHITASFDRIAVQEITFTASASAADVITLAALIHAAGQRAVRSTLPRLEGITLARLRRSNTSDAGDAALELFTANQVVLAIDQCASLIAAGAPWPWRRGRELCWRLERCMIASVSATARALELSASPWTPARRALCAAVRVAAVLVRLQASALTTRAAMHAMLLIAGQGLRPRLGVDFTEAAKLALRAVLPQAAAAEEPLSPHELRACTLIHAAAGLQAGGTTLPLARLLHAAYELERERCPGDLSLARSALDLQAWLGDAITMGTVHPQIGRALLATVGLVPAGAHVLSEGRLGVVMGGSGSGDAMRPRVLVGGRVEIPNQPVQLYSALAASPFAT